MRKIILFAFFIYPFILFAQKKSVHVSKNVQKQIDEAMKQIDELEKDDPEAARVARQLMNKMKQPQKSAPVKTSFAVAYTSSVKKIALQYPVKIPSPDQAKDHLLWYTGKKLNDHTLVTLKGTVVQFNRKSGELIIQPQKSTDPFDKIDKELSKTEDRKNVLIKKWSTVKNSFFFYPAILSSLKEMDAITESYKNIIRNTLIIAKIQETSDQKEDLHAAKGGPLNLYDGDEIADISLAIKEMYNGVMADIKNPPALDFSPPPAEQFDACYTCDSTAQKTYENNKENWFNSEFWKFELSINRRAISVIRSLMDSKDQEAVKMSQDMQEAIKVAFIRMEKKTEKLTKDYINDYPHVPIVIEANLSFERQNQLYGGGEDHSAERMQNISSALNGFDAYLRHQMEIKNYNVVFNLPVIIGIERQKQLLGSSDDAGLLYLNQVMAFNRFRLNMDISFDMNSEDMTADGSVKSAHEVYVSLGLLDCKYQLFLNKTDYGNAEEKEYRIPMIITEGIKKVHEKDHWVSYPYSGPKEMYAVFPPFRISFCDNGDDSVYLEILHYEEAAMNTASAKSIEHSYGIDFMGYLSMVYFQDPKALEAAVPKEINLGEQMLKLMGSQVSQPTGNPILDKMQDGYMKMKKMQDIQNQMSTLTLQNKLLVLFDAQNNSGDLINATVEPDHTMGEKSTIKGKVHIKVVHDPASYEH